MGIGNLYLLSQLTALVLSFILSFFVFIPVSVNHNEFKGHCLLYANGDWNKNTSQLSSVDWGPGSACNYSIFVGIVSMLLSLFYTVFFAIYLARQTDSSWLEAFITTIVTVAMTIMMFASAANVSVGFKHWCDVVTSTDSNIASCELADFIDFYEDIGNIDASGFYTEMKLAEFGSWTSFLCWLFLSTTSVIKLIKFQQHESFMTSVNRERERLLQKVGHSSSDYAI
ncbi:hypothetical protein ACF0H5_003265 [Mactra antiquata]